MREVIAVACIGCEAPGKSVYWTTKNKKNDPDRIEVKKYCSFCRQHAVHKEKR
jgi:large subunit ribosomal protein L33